MRYAKARRVEGQERQRLPCPSCGRVVAVSFGFAGRVCEVPGCGNRLAERNPGPECFACQAAEVHRAAPARLPVAA